MSIEMSERVKQHYDRVKRILSSKKFKRYYIDQLKNSLKVLAKAGVDVPSFRPIEGDDEIFLEGSKWLEEQVYSPMKPFEGLDYEMNIALNPYKIFFVGLHLNKFAVWRVMDAKGNFFDYYSRWHKIHLFEEDEE